MYEVSRRQLLRVFGSCLGDHALTKAETEIYYRDYSRCLPDYLSGLATSAYESRNRQLSLLTDRNAIQKYQQWARDTFWKIVGGVPHRTPLKTRVTGHIERPAYRVEKLVYESQPGISVSANLYIPKSGEPPYPGVLFQMGHSALGKAYPSYQRCCQGLARLGYVVLAFDPMGQGERIAYPDKSGVNTRLESVDEEHSRPGRQLLLFGETAAKYLAWDAIRSLDVLASHPLVDAKRLASTGQSGGGTLTMFLACVDERLSAAAVACGNTENFACADFDPPGSTDDAEQDFVGSGKLLFDRWDLLYPLAPKPLLLLVSEHDFFGTYSPRYLRSGGEEFTRLAQVYESLGQRDHLKWCGSPLPHSLNYSFRLNIYNWFEIWLKKSDRQIEMEPDVAPENPHVLWVGATGNVSRDFGSVRTFDMVRQRAANTNASAHARSWFNQAQIRFPDVNLRMRSLASTRIPGAPVQATEVQSANHVWVPAWLYIPPGSPKKNLALLILDEHGRNAGVQEDGLYQQLLQSGCAVCAADVRGIGDMRPEVGRGNPQYTIPHDSEQDFAWASLILGESLVEQRIQDILALLQALQNEPSLKDRRIVIAARGRLTVPALFAFTVSSIPGSIYLAGGLLSYRSIVETEEYKTPLSNFVWNVLPQVDLPALAAQAAPRKLRLAGAIDAAGKTLGLDRVRTVYTTSNVSFLDRAAWNVDALSQL
jgi:dienelactone hydrolase